ncbi:hypothetical protein CCHL11_05618 [Colletotrichum chlorophyti]|uniref:Uncharacterized protein n=1 Tax=Colletotrichum chlorophyti TaxID=708187 RepID=A0A1Q8RTK6_9PEZI|nr:hypothetical protein CCHL11_05618 [Colletotrichum chlorophyti]
MARRSINSEPESLAGKVISIIVAMISACLLASLFMVIMIYFFSFLFVFGTSILQFGFGTDLNFETCSAATFFCLGAYVSTKVGVIHGEDAETFHPQHIIRQTRTSRLKSKLYLFNSFGMLGKAICHSYCSRGTNRIAGIFVLIVIMNFIFRITHFENGICIIGMEQPVMMPLISFDAAVNVYLTILFLLPLLSLHSVKYSFWKPWTMDWRNHRIPRAPPNIRLRKLVVRTFIGSCCTLVIPGVILLISRLTEGFRNLTVLMILHGEIAWLCLLCCNTDSKDNIDPQSPSLLGFKALAYLLLVIFSALMINWITSPGQESTLRTLTRPSRGVSALSPDEAARVPLDPEGTSTRKAREQRRARTQTSLDLQPVRGPDDDEELGVREVKDDYDDMDRDDTESRHAGDESENTEAQQENGHSEYEYGRSSTSSRNSKQRGFA